MRVPICHFILYLALLFCVGCSDKEVFLDYGVGGEGRQLMKYFFDVYNGFYVDIGAYDPIFASNTLNLYTMGWDGINIEANPQRLNYFLMMRPDQTNLNFAIGDKDTFVTLFEVDEDSSSTVSPKVMEFIKGSKPVLQQIKVAAMTLKQVCNRYYFRKPIFMNLDIEGYGSKALESNDWSNPLCVPDIIFSQINEESKASGLPLPVQILKKYGYIKQNLIVGLNQIYIHESVLKSYQQKLKSAEAYINSLSYESVNSISFTLAQKLNRTTQIFKHYNPIQDRMFYKFAKINEVIDLNQLNQVSNNLAPLIQDRPIIVFNFNPNKSVLMVSTTKFTVENFKAEVYNFWEIKVQKENGKKFAVYVFDHRYGGEKGKRPVIIDAHSQFYQLQQQKKYDPPQPKSLNLTKAEQQQQNKIKKLIHQLSVEVKKQQELLSRLQSGSALQSSQLKDTFIRNHNVEINILQNISAKLGIFERKMGVEGEKKKSSQKQKSKLTNGLSLDIKNLRIIQSITLVLILVLSLSLCVTVCVLSKKAKREKYGVIQRIPMSQSSIISEQK